VACHALQAAAEDTKAAAEALAQIAVQSAKQGVTDSFAASQAVSFAAAQQ
jgi:hypothetical protein